MYEVISTSFSIFVQVSRSSGRQGRGRVYYQSWAEEIKLHGELGGHADEQLPGHVDRVLEGHGVVAVAVDDAAGELPGRILEPLLVGLDVVEGGILAQVRLHQLVELLLQAAEVLRRHVAHRLVPNVGEGVVERLVHVDEEDKAVQLVGLRIGRVVGDGGKADGGLERDGVLALDSVGAGAGVPGQHDAARVASLGFMGPTTYRSVMKNSQ